MARTLINIDVADLAAAMRFYCEAFELHPTRRLGEAAVELEGAGVFIYLLAKAPGTAAFDGDVRGTRSYERHWTPIHLDWVVDDVERAVARAVAAGAKLESAPKTHDWGTIALLADPFGHGFCLIEFSERGYGAIAEPV